MILTNGICRRLYHVVFKKPIHKQEVASFNLLDVTAKNSADLELLYLITREGFTKSAMADFRDRKDATSRFKLSAIILNSDSVTSAIRREIRRVSKLNVDEEVIDKMLREEVLKRDTIEGPDAEAAARRFAKNSDRGLRKSTEKEEREETPAEVSKPIQPS